MTNKRKTLIPMDGYLVNPKHIVYISPGANARDIHLSNGLVINTTDWYDIKKRLENEGYL